MFLLIADPLVNGEWAVCSAHDDPRFRDCFLDHSSNRTPSPKMRSYPSLYHTTSFTLYPTLAKLRDLRIPTLVYFILPHAIALSSYRNRGSLGGQISSVSRLELWSFFTSHYGRQWQSTALSPRWSVHPPPPKSALVFCPSSQCDYQPLLSLSFSQSRYHGCYTS